MSVTYPADPTKPYGDRIEAPSADLTHDEAFVPVYARRGKARGGQGKIRTWMILVPVSVLVLGGIGAMMLMDGGEEATAPLAEPARTGPVLSVTPTAPPVDPLTSALTPEPVVAAAPAVRDPAPLRRIAPAPAREPARTQVPAPATAPRVATPVPAAPAGPRAYTPAPTPPAPVIIVEPVG